MLGLQANDILPEAPPRGDTVRQHGGPVRAPPHTIPLLHALRATAHHQARKLSSFIFSALMLSLAAMPYFSINIVGIIDCWLRYIDVPL